MRCIRVIAKATTVASSSESCIKGKITSSSKKLIRLGELRNRNRSYELDIVVKQEKFSDVYKIAQNLPPTRGGWKVVTAIDYLVQHDSKFKTLVAIYGIPEIYLVGSSAYQEYASKTPFELLLKTIIFQQLQGKAAQNIYERVCNAILRNLTVMRSITPSDVLDADIKVEIIENKKKILINGLISGLSESKSIYLRSLAEHFNDNEKLGGIDLKELSDAELYNKLVAVKGLGTWSVHMFMMHALHRQDVLPLGDLGIQRGIKNYFGLKASKLNENDIRQSCIGWSPYSSFASFYMWKISDDATNNK